MMKSVPAFLHTPFLDRIGVSWLKPTHSSGCPSSVASMFLRTLLEAKHTMDELLDSCWLSFTPVPNRPTFISA